jgi:hypothetical protein
MRLSWPFGGKRQDDGEDKEWAKTADEAWVKAVDSWPWRLIGKDEWEKSDQCPWCKHEMKIEQSGAWTEDGPPAGGGGEEVAGSEAMTPPSGEQPDGTAPLPETAVQMYARCNCGEKHPGRPPDITRGCGQWGLIQPPTR